MHAEEAAGQVSGSVSAAGNTLTEAMYLHSQEEAAEQGDARGEGVKRLRKLQGVRE